MTYWMSGQILEWKRFVLFSISSVLTAISSEGFGLAIGATFTVRVMLHRNNIALEL